jgi:hypothetical protein
MHVIGIGQDEEDMNDNDDDHQQRIDSDKNINHTNLYDMDDGR